MVVVETHERESGADREQEIKLQCQVEKHGK